MALVYTQRLGSAVATALGFTTLGVCPAGQLWIVRDVLVWNAGGQDSLYAVNILTGSSRFQLLYESIQATRVLHLELRQAVYAGEQLDLYCHVALGTALITGYQFDAP